MIYYLLNKYYVNKYYYFCGCCHCFGSRKGKQYYPVIQQHWNKWMGNTNNWSTIWRKWLFEWVIGSNCYFWWVQWHNTNSICVILQTQNRNVKKRQFHSSRTNEQPPSLSQQKALQSTVWCVWCTKTEHWRYFDIDQTTRIS